MTITKMIQVLNESGFAVTRGEFPDTEIIAFYRSRFDDIDVECPQED